MCDGKGCREVVHKECAPTVPEEGQAFLCETCRVKHWVDPTHPLRDGWDEQVQPGNCATSASNIPPVTASLLTTACRLQGAPTHASQSSTKEVVVDVDNLIGRRVLEMPVAGFGKHNGTVTEATRGSSKCRITFDDTSHRTYKLSVAMKYFGEPAEVAEQKPVNEDVDMHGCESAVAGDADSSVDNVRMEETEAGSSEHEAESGDVQSAETDGADGLDLGSDQAPRRNEAGDPLLPPLLLQQQQQQASGAAESQVAVPANSIEWYIQQANDSEKRRRELEEKLSKADKEKKELAEALHKLGKLEQQLQAELAAERVQCARLREAVAALQKPSTS
jgi:hypothetical protein